MTCKLVALLSLALSFTVAACGDTSAGNNQADLAHGANVPAQDMATAPGDMVAVASCGSIESYCGQNSNLCVAAWPDAQKPATWCKPGVTASIYITATPCSAGSYGVAIVSAALTPSGRYFFYATSTAGALASVSSYDPDGSGDADCVAGPTALPATINAGGCAFANPVESVDGALQ